MCEIYYNFMNEINQEMFCGPSVVAIVKSLEQADLTEELNLVRLCRQEKRNLGYCGLITLIFTREKNPIEEWTVKSRDRQAAATPNSTPKKNTNGNLNQMLKKSDCSNMSCRQKDSSSSEEKGENTGEYNIGSSRRNRYS
ncbi:hypothetical protein DAPPUDRAFT_97495 [Daphnia pulex]|uniref:Uncharacterized protein n=1 Tax=Daphnia pulex TaxID=6669 RepID=E9G1H8_DAPPU|nr:hypothetical protein DAPPUDRAFT_97495 [Daphnia pulex]|eukprot:EFX86501.1 hypothetical protein DAPPUDRAFT_97495 [Daphnia pulex]